MSPPRLSSGSPLNGPFVVGPENRFAYTAVAELGEEGGGRARRGIFIHGPSGAGKSHLAALAARLFAARNPEARVLHQTADRFAADFAEASSEKRIARFQAETRQADLLVLEDLHVLEGRPETQRQVLSLADEVAAHGGQIVWTSAKSAGELAEFSPKLISRLRGGVTAGVRLPDRESREKLVVHFAAQRQVGLPAECAAAVARELAVSPRELLAAVTQLEAVARHKKRPVDSDLVRKFLDREVLPGGVSLGDISRAVARQFGLGLKDLRAATRSRRVAVPRQCAMYLSRELTGQGLAAIARHYRRRRDHTTVLHACRKISVRLADDPALRRQLAEIRSSLGVGEGEAGSGILEVGSE